MTVLAGEPVGFGVIGVGLMGTFHAANLARHVDGARLTALADPQPGLAEELANRLDCRYWTRDIQELLANPGVEAVVITAPAEYHADTMVAAAQAGKAVFCEKPLANTLADADRAIAAVQAAGVSFKSASSDALTRGSPVRVPWLMTARSVRCNCFDR